MKPLPVMDQRDIDVLVIGSGLAGCAAALAAAARGARVLLLTKAARPEESNTWYAQGGIIYRGGADSPDRLAADILAAGDGLCNPAAVELLAREGRGRRRPRRCPPRASRASPPCPGR